MRSNDQLDRLEREVRWLRIGMVALTGTLMAAAALPHADDLRARRIAIVDGRGRERIVLDVDNHEGRPSIDVLSPEGMRRVSVGEADDARVDGKRVPRIAPAWGLMIHDPAGDERGGIGYLDNGRSVISLDRARGEGVYMTVNEKSGFAGLVSNYETGRAGEYAEAIRIGTLGRAAFAQVANRDGTPGGAVSAGGGGRAKIVDVVQR